MVEIRGKRGRKVPVILTTEMISSINLLIKTKKDVGIPNENPYIFARPSRQSLDHMRACDCLRKFATQCEPVLSNPAAITSTKLRKPIATISQVRSLKETEVDWLARHLGHDIRVHRDFYRLHQSTIEIAKVSKLLLTVDQGETSKFVGKTLAEIDLNGKWLRFTLRSPEVKKIKAIKATTPCGCRKWTSGEFMLGLCGHLKIFSSSELKCFSGYLVRVRIGSLGLCGDIVGTSR